MHILRSQTDCKRTILLLRDRKQNMKYFVGQGQDINVYFRKDAKDKWSLGKRTQKGQVINGQKDAKGQGPLGKRTSSHWAKGRKGQVLNGQNDAWLN